MTVPALRDPVAHPDRSTAARHLLRRAAVPGPDGLVCGVDPESAGWDWTTFHVYRLAPGQRVTRTADEMERLLLVLEGHAAIMVGDRDLGVQGSRDSVFDGPPPPIVLVEPGLAVEIVATTAALVGVAAAPGGPVRRTALVAPEDILVEARGEGNTARRIHHLLPPSAEAGRIIAFEVFTPGGNWSSYPPHKHDTENPPVEARLEELYYYRFAKPAQAFAFARVYTADRTLDEAMTPMDGDLVLVPEGYHPVGVPAGYDCYYLNIMAGPNRAWHFTLDPDHAWLMNWSPPSATPPTGPRA
jgi:5-deoxy-glucuronate isomerase